MEDVPLSPEPELKAVATISSRPVTPQPSKRPPQHPMVTSSTPPMTSDRPRRTVKPKRPWSPTVYPPSSRRALKEVATTPEEIADDDDDDKNIEDQGTDLSESDFNDDSSDFTVSSPERDTRKCKSFSVEEKLAILAEVESGRKKTDICRKHSISSSTLSTFLKVKDLYVTISQVNLANSKRVHRAARQGRNLARHRPLSPTGSESSNQSAIKQEVTATEDITGDGVEDNVADETPGNLDNSCDDVSSAVIVSMPKRAVQPRSYRKRTSLTITEKLALLAEVEKGRKKVDICREYGIPSSTLSTYMNHKDVYLTAVRENRCEAKRLRASHKEDLSRALLRWYHQTSALGSPPNGPQLQSKAEELARHLGYEDCTVSSTWIYRFRSRHSLNVQAGQNKEAQQDLPDSNAWVSTSWPQIRSGYPEWDVFSAVEVGLLFRVLPSEARLFRGSVCEQGQLADERLTLLLCANMTGDEKRPLLAVGCAPLSNTAAASSVRYSFNERAWMTRAIFIEELKRWDRELNARKRKVLLLVDHCPCHLVNRKVGLQNIEVVYPPPGMVGDLLPLDHGVVQLFKRQYRKILMVHSVLQEAMKPIMLEEALRLLNAAWKKVKEPTIRLAFSACGLHSDSPYDDVPADDKNVPLEEWASQFNLSEDLVDGIYEYDCIDDFLVTSGKLEIEGLHVHPTHDVSVKTEVLGSSEQLPSSSRGVLDAVGMLLEFCKQSSSLTSPEDASVMEALVTLRTKAEAIAFQGTYALKGE